MEYKLVERKRLDVLEPRETDLKPSLDSETETRSFWHRIREHYSHYGSISYVTEGLEDVVGYGVPDTLSSPQLCSAYAFISTCLQFDEFRQGLDQFALQEAEQECISLLNVLRSRFEGHRSPW